MSWPEAKYIIDNVHAGITPNNMAMFACTIGDQCIKVKFTDPADTIIDNQVIASWKGTKIVIKQGSDPITDENDGTVVLDNQVRGAYTDTALTISDLTNDQNYTVAAFPYSDQNVYNRNSENQRTVAPKAYILLGFKIDKTDSNPATRITYTEQAVGLTPAAVDLSTGAINYGSFSDFWFVTENKPYMVKSTGVADYQLDPSDYTKKADGTASDVSNTSYDGNAMAKIPLVWMKQWQDSSYEYCNICNIQLDENYQAYSHMRSDGTVMDYIWLSCFDGSLSSSKIRSLKGLATMNTQTGANEITYAKNNGTLWYTRSWSQRNLINMLLILMGKSDNTQAVFGYGHYTGGSAASSLLTTGTLSDKGQFCGYSATGKAMKVFHIENWWGNCWERIAGLMYVSGTIRTKMYPTYNTDGTGYTNTGVTMGGTSGGYCSATKMTDQGRLPVTMSGSDSTYTCDGGWFNASQVDYALVGGPCGNGLLVGASCVNLDNLVSDSVWAVGAALSCEQPAA